MSASDEPKDELDEREAAAKASLAAVEERRAERREKAERQRRVEELEREAKEQEILEQLEQEHGPLNEAIRPVYTPEGMIVVKRPQAISVRKYMDKQDVSTKNMEQLFRPCVVYPDKGELNRLLDKYGAFYAKCADAVCWLAGFGRKELEGKSESSG